MSTIEEKVLDILRKNPPPKLKIVNIKVSPRYLSLREDQTNWSPANGDDYLSLTLNDAADYTFDCISGNSTCSERDIYRDFKYTAMNSLYSIVRSTSYNKSPKMTKLYKGIVKLCEIVKYSRESYLSKADRDSFLDAAIKISDYYKTSTKEHGIKSEENKVHRKNIYSLLVLMEKKYAEKKNK
jgi:hypothetical protein